MLAPCVFQDELQSAAHHARGDGAVFFHWGWEHPAGVHCLFIFICAFTLVACSGQQTNEPLTLGVNAIITEIDKENKIITTKDSGEEGVLGDDCLIDCSQIPMIYCNYDTQDVIDITLDDLQVGDEIILTIRSSEIENLQKEDGNKTKIEVEQLQLGTQRIR